MIYLGYHGITNGLFVLRPERKRPLRALRMTAPDAAALPIHRSRGLAIATRA